MASLTAPTTSTFARLFKQSKFSSFDPAISQVYTAHGGDAHRGHWGFKRPLAIRRRGAYITVRNVDTPEYQTEWNSAEQQAAWMKNWDELKITPSRIHDLDRADVVEDSEFVPAKGDAKHWRQAYLPNLEVMPRHEFKKYLEQVRRHRDQFVLKQQPSGEHMTTYQLSNSYKSTPWHDLVAGHISRERRANPRSKAIEHMPHTHRGLTYTHNSLLQTFLMTKERKARMTDEHMPRERNQKHYVASFAGVAARVWPKHAGSARPMVWEDPNNTGVVTVRPQKVVLDRWPSVVGAREGMKAANVVMDLRVWDEQVHHRSNPHPPGSREYIAAASSKTIQEMTSKIVFGRVGRGKKRTYSGTTLSLLKTAMRRPGES